MHRAILALLLIGCASEEIPDAFEGNGARTSASASTEANETTAAGDPASKVASPAGAATSAKTRLFSTSRENAATAKAGLKIHTTRTAAEKDPSVVYDVDVDAVKAGDPIRVVSSMQASYCLGPDIDDTDDKGSPDSPCQKLTKATSYPIHLGVRIRDEKSTLEEQVVTCTHNDHHCPVVFDFKVDSIGKHVTAEMFAWTDSNDWKGGDVMEIETDPNDGGSSKGRLAVVVGAADRNASTLGAPVNLDLNSASGTVVKSIRIDGAKAGEILQATAEAHIQGKSFDHYAGSWFVLAKDAKSSRPSGDIERYVSGVNGLNCLGSGGTISSQGSGECTIHQAGAVEVPANAPATLFLNYVVQVKDHQTTGQNPGAVVDRASFTVSR